MEVEDSAHELCEERIYQIRKHWPEKIYNKKWRFAEV